MYYIITKGLAKAWLRKLIKQGVLVAPTELSGGDVIFKEVLTTEDILLEYKQPLYSIKSYFLPQEETLFTFRDNSIKTLKEVYDEFPRIFFGLRPCDLKSITQADRFFSEGFQDPYYYHRRKQTLLVVIGCNNPESHCFCHVMGIGPHYRDRADIFMVDLGPCFAVTAGTPKGTEAIEEYSYFFETVTKEQEAQIIAEEKSAIDKLNFNMANGIKLPDFNSIEDAFWEKTSRRCFNCGSCSYVCPLCFCYNVVDRQQQDLQGKRVRTWDSCIFEGFSRMAGRHNLYKNRQDRLKRRYAHKLYQYPETYGYMGCTGCGRCTITCPGKIGMKNVIKDLAEVAANGEK